MSTASYNCPCCGGPLTFSGKSGKLECASCGNSFEPEALEMLNTAESGEQIVFERPKRKGFRRTRKACRSITARTAARS